MRGRYTHAIRRRATVRGRWSGGQLVAPQAVGRESPTCSKCATRPRSTSAVKVHPIPAALDPGGKGLNPAIERIQNAGCRAPHLHGLGRSQNPSRKPRTAISAATRPPLRRRPVSERRHHLAARSGTRHRDRGDEILVTFARSGFRDESTLAGRQIRPRSSVSLRLRRGAHGAAAIGDRGFNSSLILRPATIVEK